MPSTSTSSPHHFVRTSWARSSNSSTRSSGSCRHSSAWASLRPMPWSSTWARAVARMSTVLPSSSLAAHGRGEGHRVEPAAEARRQCRAGALPKVSHRRHSGWQHAREPSVRGHCRPGRRRCSASRDRASSGQLPMTRPASSTPSSASRSTVSAVWLSVPSPAAVTTRTAARSVAARSTDRPPIGVGERDEQAAGALDEDEVVHRVEVGDAADRVGELQRRPAAHLRRVVGRQRIGVAGELVDVGDAATGGSPRRGRRARPVRPRSGPA